MEQPKDIFPPVHRKKMGDQDRRRYTGHFQKFLGRLLIDKEQSKRPNGHDNQKGMVNAVKSHSQTHHPKTNQ